MKLCWIVEVESGCTGVDANDIKWQKFETKHPKQSWENLQSSLHSQASSGRSVSYSHHDSITQSLSYAMLHDIVI